ncbi:MAG: oligoendopeptidase F [Bacilli bacterium]
MERKNIDNSYKWNLSHIYKNEEEFKSDIQKIKELTKNLISSKKDMFKTGSNFLKLLKLQDEISITINRLYVYSYLFYCENTTNDKAGKLISEITNISQDINEKTFDIDNSIIKISDEVYEKLLSEEDGLLEYKQTLKVVRRFKNHTLEDDKEEIFVKSSDFSSIFSDAYDSLTTSDITFDKIEHNGEKLDFNESLWGKYCQNNDRDLRKKAYESLYKSYKAVKHTAYDLYKGHLKSEKFYSKTHEFNSTLENALYANNISTDIYNNLINSVNKNLDKIQSYFTMKKEFLGLEKLNMFDVYMPMCFLPDETFEFEKSKIIVKDSLKILGEEYHKALCNTIDSDIIDVYPSDNKMTGAFCYATYTTHPYVLLNHNDNFNSLSTLAHEIGHAMHSYFSNKYRNYTDSKYPIFTAEIASIVNEVILNDYMVKNSNNDKLKKYILGSMIEKIEGSLFRQIMFAEFEKEMHENIDKNIPITVEDVCNYYGNLVEKYHGPSVNIDENIKHEWIRISHFYSSFYVYQYATGICIAINIANEIISGNEIMKKNYIDFLKSGSFDYPLNLIAKLGIDLSDDTLYDETCEYFGNLIKEFNNLK